MIRAAGDLDPHSSYSTLYEKFRKNGNDEIENFYEILSVILGYYTGPIEKQDIKKNHKNFNKFVQKLNEMENTKNSNFLEKKNFRCLSQKHVSLVQNLNHSKNYVT